MLQLFENAVSDPQTACTEREIAVPYTAILIDNIKGKLPNLLKNSTAVTMVM